MCGHVLIIEDEILIAFVLEDELRDLGFTSFDFAVSAEEALASAQLRKPDLITVDYRINGGTGVEALERLDRELGALPAIFVTANPELIAGDRAPVVGKPLRPRALAGACREATSIARSRRGDAARDRHARPYTAGNRLKRDDPARQDTLSTDRYQL